MVDLHAKSPCAGLLPLSVGALSLREADLGQMTSLAPYQGQEAALSDALQAAHGVTFPASNRTRTKGDARVLWFGQGMALLTGPEPAPELARHAALTDQSDAWAAVRLEGPGAPDVLARLTPLDLRPSVFETGHTARSELQHMMASITRVDEEAWLILVFRAFAETLVHDLETAMQSVAAR